MKPCDVTIVGAGPVGLTLALALAKQDISVKIIEKSKNYSIYSKALTLQPRSLELLDVLGISKVLVDQGVRIFADNLYRGKKLFTKVRYETLESPFPYLIHLEQGEIERIIDEALLTSYGIATERGATLVDCKQDENSVMASIKYEDGQTKEVRSSYLVGCDGHSSTVRDLIGLPLKREIRDNHYLMADTKISNLNLNQNERHVFLLKELAVGILPIRQDYYRIVVLKDDSPKKKQDNSNDFADRTVPLESFEEILSKVGLSEAKLYDPRWLTWFSPKQGIVEEYQKKRIFLAGDSAHVQSPTGARGLNTGIQDAYNLAWKLGFVIKKRLKQNLLSSYHTDRYPVALELFKFNNERESFLKKNGLIKLLTKIKIYFLKLKKFNKIYAEIGSELKVNYRNRIYIQPSNTKKALWNFFSNNKIRFIVNVLPGDRVPDIPLASLDGKLHKNLFQLLRLDRYLLLILCSDLVEEKYLKQIIATLQSMFEKYGRIIEAHFIFNRKPSYNVPFIYSPYWTILNSRLFNTGFKNKEFAYCVIRPDGHMAHYNVFKVSEAIPFLKELENASRFKDILITDDHA